MDGEKLGAMWPVPSCSPQSGNTVTRSGLWRLASKGLKADKPVAPYGTPREVAEVVRLAAPAGHRQLFELQGWKEAPREHLARWQQLVHPALAGRLAGRQAGHRRPKGSGRCSRWTGDPQGLIC